MNTTIGAGLYAANAHEYGPGKIHIVDAEDTGSTLCGKWLNAVPGQIRSSGKATCKICLNAVENRVHSQARQEMWREEQERRAIELAQESRERKEQYAAYLKTPAWRERREAVMRRAGGMCEGCGKRKASHVHHLTYEHIFQEFLWELRAICVTCHDRVHGHEHTEVA